MTSSCIYFIFNIRVCKDARSFSTRRTRGGVSCQFYTKRRKHRHLPTDERNQAKTHAMPRAGVEALRARREGRHAARHRTNDWSRGLHGACRRPLSFIFAPSFPLAETKRIQSSPVQHTPQHRTGRPALAHVWSAWRAKRGCRRVHGRSQRAVGAGTARPGPGPSSPTRRRHQPSRWNA